MEAQWLALPLGQFSALVGAKRRSFLLPARRFHGLFKSGPALSGAPSLWKSQKLESEFSGGMSASIAGLSGLQ
jgi:hypothetical protein